MPKKSEQIIDPIDATLDQVASAVVKVLGTSNSSNKNNELASKEVLLGTAPIQASLFYVDLLDEDGVSEIDASQLYYLSKQAMTNGDTKQLFHDTNAASDERMLEVIQSPEISSAIAVMLAKTYRDKFGVKANVTAEAVKESVEFTYEVYHEATS
jgi:hypothetical protein